MASECTIIIKDRLSLSIEVPMLTQAMGCACSVLFLLREPSPSLFWTVWCRVSQAQVQSSPWVLAYLGAC